MKQRRKDRILTSYFRVLLGLSPLSGRELHESKDHVWFLWVTTVFLSIEHSQWIFVRRRIMHVCWRMVEVASKVSSAVSSLAGNSQLFTVHHKMYFSFFSYPLLSFCHYYFKTWGIVDLQCCANLCFTAVSQLYTYTHFLYLYIFLNGLPCWLRQYRIFLPCRRPGLNP